MEGTKFDGGKPTPEYIDPVFILEMAAGMGFGVVKYDEWNFTKGMRWTRLIGGTFRHLLKFAVGIEYDKETGISHIALAGCGLNMLYTHWRAKLGEDNRLILPGTEAHIDRICDNLERVISEWREKKKVAQPKYDGRSNKAEDHVDTSVRVIPEDPNEPIII